MNSYEERRKEWILLKKQLYLIKKQKNVSNFDQQLAELSKFKNELSNNLSVINESVKFINQKIENVELLLRSDSKIAMPQKCAESMKSVIKTALVLPEYREHLTHLRKDNLNLNTDELIENIAYSINNYKTTLQYSLMFITSIGKIMNPDRMTEIQNITPDIKTTDLQCTTKNSNDSMEGITFSQAIASSPVQYCTYETDNNL